MGLPQHCGFVFIAFGVPAGKACPRGKSLPFPAATPEATHRSPTTHAGFSPMLAVQVTLVIRHPATGIGDSFKGTLLASNGKEGQRPAEHPLRTALPVPSPWAPAASTSRRWHQWYKSRQTVVGHFALESLGCNRSRHRNAANVLDDAKTKYQIPAPHVLRIPARRNVPFVGAVLRLRRQRRAHRDPHRPHGRGRSAAPAGCPGQQMAGQGGGLAPRGRSEGSRPSFFK